MKNRKKKDRLTLFTLFAIIITIIALIATSGTYAKYTDKIESNASGAKIARWNVVLDYGGADNKLFGTSGKIDYNIFDYVYDQDGTDYNPESATTEGDINQENGKRIAPGTWGAKNFVITNSSDVPVIISTNFHVVDSSPNIPIKFALVDVTEDNQAVPSTWQSASAFASSLSATTYIIPKVSVSGETVTSSSRTYRIYWKWDYDIGGEDQSAIATADAADSTLGANAVNSDIAYNVEVSFIATQAD